MFLRHSGGLRSNLLYSNQLNSLQKFPRRNLRFSRYNNQAFRAANQAMGRVIRHRDDFGAVLLWDQRWSGDWSKLPKWIQDLCAIPERNKTTSHVFSCADAFFGAAGEQARDRARANRAPDPPPSTTQQVGILVQPPPTAAFSQPEREPSTLASQLLSSATRRQSAPPVPLTCINGFPPAG